MIKLTARKAVVRCSLQELERDLMRTKKTLSNKALLQRSKGFYSRRRQMIETEMRRRAAQL